MLPLGIPRSLQNLETILEKPKAHVCMTLSQSVFIHCGIKRYFSLKYHKNDILTFCFDFMTVLQQLQLIRRGV